MTGAQLVEASDIQVKDEVEFAIKSGKDTGIVKNLIVGDNTLQYKVIWSDKSVGEHDRFELVKKGGK